MSFPAEMSMDGLPKAPASQPQRGGRGGRKGMSANRMSQPSSRGGNPSNSSPTANLASRMSGSSKQHGGSKIPRPAAESSGGGRPGHKDRSAKRVDPLAGTKPRTNAIEVLRTWLQRRWNPAAAMLDLSKMYKDSFLLEKEVFPPGHRLTRPTMARVLWKLVGELQPPVVTISYESNNLSNLESLESISQHVPSVRNLSIANNPLKDNESIKTLVSLKTGLTELRELITIGCPFRDTQIEVRGVEGYKTFMTGHLPFLRLLDSEPIFSLTFDLKADDIPPEPIVPPSTKTGNNSDPTSAQLRPLPLFPLSLKQNFFFGDADFVNSFLAKFFPLFDTARAELLPVYGQTSTFSVSTSNHMPPRARAANFHTSLPNQRALTWRPYTDIQRNLLRVGKLEARINRLFVGADKIIGAFTGKGGETSVPATKHPLDQPAKWSIDSVQVDREVGGPLLIVTVHGEFEEMPAMGLRSFDRTFILSPSAPDSPAVAAGWPCVILSDQLTVRIYSSSTAFEDNSIPVSPAASQPLVPSALPVAPSAQPQLTDQQKEVLVSQLAQKSGLNVAFSIQCLEGNGWDLERAWANFLELKPQIPKEAYA